MKHFLFLSFIVMLVLSACQKKSVNISGEKVDTAGGAYINLAPNELNAMLKDKDFVFVNVHIPFAGNIVNTDLSIPYDQITEQEYFAQLPTDKNAKIVLYCRSGRMSTIAAEKLIDLGFANIWNLDGGMVEWELAGYDIEK
ncbi:MAG TPA: rhodanese-like domain-containing protein [Anaerolineales bacterium]